jgi:hypothetical protein
MSNRPQFKSCLPHLLDVLHAADLKNLINNFEIIVTSMDGLMALQYSYMRAHTSAPQNVATSRYFL